MKLTHVQAWPLPEPSNIALRFFYSDGSVIDVCAELYQLFRIKLAPYADCPWYDDVW